MDLKNIDNSKKSNKISKCFTKKKKKKEEGSNKMEKKQNEDRCENINNDIIWDDCFLGINLFSLYVWIYHLEFMCQP